MSDKPPVKIHPAVKNAILVAGDVCLDVVGVPMPPEMAKMDIENWRLTGDLRTHYLTGGAMLLAELVKAAVGKSRKQRVVGPAPVWPFGLCGAPSEEEAKKSGKGCAAGEGAKPKQPMATKDFLKVGCRLCRTQIIHSLLQLGEFPTGLGAKKKDTTWRVEKTAGFSGPNTGDPTMEFDYPGVLSTSVLVLDDTGNTFRSKTGKDFWKKTVKMSPDAKAKKPWIIYKLHRPLPGSGPRVAENPLWDAAKRNCEDRRIAVVSVSDLRAAGVPISLGLSWERTALDVVWHLQNTNAFVELRNCPWLVVRLGLDGAVIWRSRRPDVEDDPGDQAWLVYDPEGIEGSYAEKLAGQMIGVGSAFVAGLVGKGKFPPDKGTDTADDKDAAPQALVAGVQAGLLAARRLLHLGYGKNLTDVKDPANPPCLDFPGERLFDPRKDRETEFACQPIPIIRNALTPDRGGWRLLNQVFHNKKYLVNHAAMQLASGSKPDPKDDDAIRAAKLMKQVPLAVFGKLRTHDRWEMEYYRSLHTLLSDYLRTDSPSRPLSFAVFGPPGAGKSFGVKEVAASLDGQLGCREVKPITFNLSLYQSPEDLAGAFHLVRDVALEGKVPMVFFDEFDTALDGLPLGWLRHFLAPMQDGKFLDRGSPHPIGQAIFVFAGGTCVNFREFRQHPGMDDTEFRQRKGPDFLSRLRATLDIPSLNLPSAFTPDPDPTRPGEPLPQPPDTYDPFGPIESLPCKSSILLRRASILGFNLRQKAPCICCADGCLDVDLSVLRAMLFLPSFEHGNRSFEALLDMSHLAKAESFSPSLLPPPFQIPLHADAEHFGHLVGTQTPFSKEDQEAIAKAIHEAYLEERRRKNEYRPDKKKSHWEWDGVILSGEDEPVDELPERYKDSNKEQADDIPRKLLSMGLWLRKKPVGLPAGGGGGCGPLPVCVKAIEEAARQEHDRWVADQRTQGHVYGSAEDSALRTHPCMLPWYDGRLAKAEKDKDEEAVRRIPEFLAAADYEVIVLSSPECLK